MALTKITHLGDSDGNNLGVGTTTPYAYDTTATNFEVKGSVASAAAIEVARFRGGQDANGGAAVLRLTNDNDRGLVLKGGRESDAEFAEIGTSSFNGTYTKGLRINDSGLVMIGPSTTKGDSAADDLTITSSANVGVTLRSAADGYSSIYLADGTTTTENYKGYIQYYHATNNYHIGVNAVEKIRVHADGATSFASGIGLGNGLTYAADNTLDDYEEGAFTPTFASSSGSFTTLTFHNTLGRYVKVGRQVTCWIRIYVNAIDDTGASGAVRINGLPFTCSTGTEYDGATLNVNYYNALSNKTGSA